MNIILGYIIIYLAIFGSIFISTIFNKKIESCIGIDLILKMIILYIFGLLGIMELGVIAVSASSILLGILSIIIFRKKINIKENVVNYGILFFTIVYFVFMIFTYNKVAEVWDEFTYWSIISKKMFYSNKLLNEGMKIIYPPSPTLLQYYFNKTVGIYSQGREAFANILLSISLLLPLFEKIKKENKFKLTCLSIIIMCIPAIFDGIMTYQSIYADAALAFMIGAYLYIIYNNKEDLFKILSMAIVLIGITLTKPTGFYISLILVAITILYYLFLALKDKKLKRIQIIKNKKNILATVLLIATVLVTYGSYCMYSKDFVHYSNTLDDKINELISKEFISVPEAIGTLKTTLLGSNDDSYEFDTSNRNIVLDLIRYTAIRYPVRISLLFFLSMYVAGCAVLYKKYVEKNDKNKFKFFIIAILTGFILYTIAIQIAYLTQFGYYEKMEHASFNRYINTYYLGIFVVLFSIILESIEKNEKNAKYKYLILTIVILSITQVNSLVDVTIASGNYNNTISSSLSEMEKEAKFIKEKTESSDKIYAVNQESNLAPKISELKYFLCPDMELNEPDKLTSEAESKFESGKYFEIWKDMLYNDYDYLYIYKTDTYFNNFSRSIFSNKPVKEKTLYKIEKQDNKINLIEIIRNNEGENNEKN